MRAVDVFLRMRTQWRSGPGGRTGLDYTALYPMMERLHLTDDEWLRMLDDIYVMECAALEVIHEQASK